MRFRLRTLLLLLAILPPLLALAWFYWPPAPVAPTIEDDPYEIIWDDYAPNIVPPKQATVPEKQP